MEENVTPEVVDKTPAPPGYYTDKKKERIDFWIGFGGSIVGNVLLALLQIALTALVGGTTSGANPQSMGLFILNTSITLLPWVLNIAAIFVVLVVLHRKWIAFGILAAYGAALALAIIAGIVIMIACLGSGLTG